MIRTYEQLHERAAAARRAQSPQRVLVCAGTGCLANGSQEVYDVLRALVDELSVQVDIGLNGDAPCLCGVSEPVAVKHSGCHGFCEMGPLVRIEPSGLLYCKVRPSDVEEIVERTILKGEVIDRLIYHHPRSGEQFSLQEQIPFYARQTRLTLANCGHIDPDVIDEYLANGGYEGMARALLQMTPDQVLDEVSASGLRGRGGGGFPTGRKWAMARQNPSSVKYVICNGDEGDPGAFMDRSVMEGDPHRVIEGMVIAGYAIGAHEGVIYVRAEYPLAVQRLREAIRQARDNGLLGENVLGSGFAFDLTVKEGAGAFVCGEEGALIASVEGKRGMPVPKPPYPAQSGLWDHPTIINNVETLAAVPVILSQGAAYFQQYGVDSSPGTKTFALTGDIANTGLIEVPMGMTLREILFDIGGGIRNGKQFKAVQIGGPSGGCLTAEHLDLPLDYDALQSAGAMIGSGGLVVMDEDTCMVEVARFFMSFTQNESCGKCVLCREGTYRMLELLTGIVEGKGTTEDIALLEELSWTVKDGSLCGLGKTAPNPVLTTLHYFRDEYMAHVVDKRCPAGVCQGLREYRIDPDLCRGCGLCLRTCPVNAISGQRKQLHSIDSSICVRCGACVDVCRLHAIKEVAR